MNLPLSLPSPLIRAGERVAEGREKGIRTGSWSQFTAARPRRLFMRFRLSPAHERLVIVIRSLIV